MIWQRPENVLNKNIRNLKPKMLWFSTTSTPNSWIVHVLCCHSLHACREFSIGNEVKFLPLPKCYISHTPWPFLPSSSPFVPSRFLLSYLHGLHSYNSQHMFSFFQFFATLLFTLSTLVIMQINNINYHSIDGMDFTWKKKVTVYLQVCFSLRKIHTACLYDPMEQTKSEHFCKRMRQS